jgi:hypothetical protein
LTPHRYASRDGTKSIESDVGLCQERAAVDTELRALCDRLLYKMRPGTYQVGPHVVHALPLATAGWVYLAVLRPQESSDEILLIVLVTARDHDLTEARNRLAEWIEP